MRRLRQINPLPVAIRPWGRGDSHYQWRWKWVQKIQIHCCCVTPSAARHAAVDSAKRTRACRKGAAREHKVAELTWLPSLRRFAPPLLRGKSPIRVPKTRQEDRMSIARAKDTDAFIPRAMMSAGVKRAVVAGVGWVVVVARSTGVRERFCERK